MRYLILFCCAALQFACTAQAVTDETPTVNINGLWTDGSTEHCNNCYAIIAQDGDKIFFAHYLEWQGQPMVEYGEGTRTGDTIEYEVTVTRAIPGWATAGKHTLKVDDDGKTLTGHYSDNQGNRGPFSLRRVGQ